MSKQLCFILAISLALFIAAPVYATETETPIVINVQESDEIQQIQQRSEQLQTNEPPPPVKAAMPAPINVECKNVDGDEFLIKTFEVAADFDPNTLVEKGYEKDGFIFAHHTTEKKLNEIRKTKEIVETVQVETDSKSLEDILKRLPTTKSYDADGFAGTLALDTGSILTEVSGYTTKTSTISTVQEYPGLMYADPTYIPQSAAKDGTTLPLTDVQWTVTGSGLAGDSLVPTEYKATATYSKNVSSQVPTGYVTKANYKGIVEKADVDTVNYIVTYSGTPMYVANPEPTPEPVPLPWGILFAVLGIAAACGGGVFLFFLFKSRQGIQIYNLIDEDYICIGRQVVDWNKPVLDLNHFKDIIQSNTFTFILDKVSSKKLFGKNIAITLDDVTVLHMVKGYNEEYRFNLELGGILDVK